MSKKLTLLLFSLLFALALAEAGLRLAGTDLNLHPQWKFHPSLGWVIDPRSESIDTVQPDGFRHSALTEPKPEGTRRLLVLGDSFALGASFPYSKTFPGVLERRLNQSSDEPWQVINLSVDDWGSAQQLIALEEIGFAYRPDAVLVEAFAFNDLCNNSLALAFTCSLQDLQRPYFVMQDGHLEQTALHPWRSALRNHLKLFGLLENLLDTRQRGPDLEGASDPDQTRRRFFLENARQQGLEYEGAAYALIPQQLQPPVIRQAWQLTEAIFARLAELLQERQIPWLAMAVPFSATFDPQWEELRRVFPAPMVRDAGSRRLERCFQRLGASVVPVRQLIQTSGRPPADFFISPQDGHFGIRGHAQVAEWILEELVRQGVAQRKH